MKEQLEQLKALQAKQWAAFKEADAVSTARSHEWCDTSRKIESLEQEIEVERLVAERLAGKVA